MAASIHLTAQVQTIIRRTIHQYYINQAVQQGHPSQQLQAGSITFLQRFGSSLNLNRGPRCASIHGFSLHANIHVAAHRRDQLERLIHYTARGAISLERLTLDANGDLIYTFTQPWSDGTTGIQLSPLELLEKLAAWVPPPRVHQVQYAGGLAAHSNLRGAITPTPRQQGIETQARPVASRWAWARWFKRVFALDLERCPRGHSGTLRIIAAITCRPIIRRILCRLKLAADPPPLAAARLEPGRFA